MRVGGLNVSFSHVDRQDEFVDHMFRDADLNAAMVNENRRRAEAYKPRRAVMGKQPEGYSSQAIILKPGIEVLRGGSRQAFSGRFGQKIDWRRNVWAITKHEDFGEETVALMSSHAPPRYMWFTGINELYGRGLRRDVHNRIKHGHEVALYLDSNSTIKRHGDAHGLRSVGLRLVEGDRIDQLWVSKGLRAVEAGEVGQARYGRRDDHPMVWADLYAVKQVPKLKGKNEPW